MMNLQVAKYVVEQRHRDLREQSERIRLAGLARRARKAKPSLAYAPLPIPTGSLIGASDAVQIGPVIEVGGTGSTTDEGVVLHRGDAYLQMKEALNRVGESLRRKGAGLEDVVRTRVYLKKAWQWQDVGRAHVEVFRDIRPVTTFVGAGAFPHPDILVEVEATAIVR